MRRPFVWFLISLIAGIICGRYTDAVTAAAVILAITASAVIFMRRNSTKEFIFLPPIAVIGFMLCASSLKGLPADIFVNKYVCIRDICPEYFSHEGAKSERFGDHC